MYSKDMPPLPALASDSADVSLRPVDPVPQVEERIFQYRSRTTGHPFGRAHWTKPPHHWHSTTFNNRCLIVSGYPLLRDEGRISGCSSGVQSSQFFGAAHRPKPPCQSALNNSSIFSSVVSCSDLFFMTKNFLFMTKRLWQSGSNKLSFMTRRRKKKKGLQAATKWSLRRGWWQNLSKPLLKVECGKVWR